MPDSRESHVQDVIMTKEAPNYQIEQQSQYFIIN